MSFFSSVQKTLTIPTDIKLLLSRLIGVTLSRYLRKNDPLLSMNFPSSVSVSSSFLEPDHYSMVRRRKNAIDVFWTRKVVWKSLPPYQEQHVIYKVYPSIYLSTYPSTYQKRKRESSSASDRIVYYEKHPALLWWI